MDIDVTTHCLTDSPLTSGEADRFQRAPLATKIAHSIATQPDPKSIVYGVYGEWGEGKTSFLNFIAEALTQTFEDSVVWFRFNPWQFQSDEALIRSFFDTLAHVLSRHVRSAGEDLAKAIQKYAKGIGGIVSVVPGMSGVSEGVQQLAGAFSSIELTTLKTRIESVIAEEQKRIVVFFDDIDRLDDDAVQAIFSLVKVAADFDRTTYVLALDPHMVSAALARKYSGSDRAGVGFLEKIIQVPIHLPLARQGDLRALVFEHAKHLLEENHIELTRHQGSEFVSAFDTGILPMLRTPRAVIRYINALGFAVPMTKDEVHPVDLLLIEGLRVFYSKVYERVRRNSDLLTQSSTSSRGGPSSDEGDRVKDSLLKDALPPQQEEPARALLVNLFPRLEQLWSDGDAWNGLPSGEVLERQQRVGSRAYFDRYFSYGIPVTDVADSSMVALVEKAGHVDGFEEAKAFTLSVLTDEKAGSFIRKLRLFEDRLSINQARCLARVIGSCAILLPVPLRAFLNWGHPFSDAAILVKRLIDRIPDPDQRFASAVQILDESPLLFAAECFQWVSREPETPQASEDVRVQFTVEQETALAQPLVERIRATAAKAPLYVTAPAYSPFLFFLWSRWGSKDEVEAHIRTAFEHDPRSAVDFIRPTLPEVMSRPAQAGVRRKTYDKIRDIIDPAVVCDALKIAFGEELTKSETFGDSGSSLDLRLAHEFVDFHRLMLESGEGAHATISSAEDHVDRVDSRSS